jgi:hypothetical protein
MTDSITYGGDVYPLPAALTNSLLQDADRFLFLALDYFAAMIAAYAGTRLVAESAACGAPIHAAVASQYPYEPGPYLREEQIKLPALFMHRKSSRNEYVTIARAHEITTLECNYVLPPLSPAQAERVLPVRGAVKKILNDRIEAGRDPGYTPPFAGSTPGQHVWKLAGVESVTISECIYGGFTDGGDLYMPAVTITIVVKERHEGMPGVRLTGSTDALSITDGKTVTDPVANLTTNLTAP